MAKPKLAPTKDEFLKVLESSDGLFHAMEPYLIGSYVPRNTPVHRKQAERIVALAFMSIVAAWEEFVIGSFLRYLCGVKSPANYGPTLRLGSCVDLSHATDLLSGQSDFDIEKNFLSMTSWEKVVGSAKIYFSGGAPYSSLNHIDVLNLQRAVAIRNRVAHKSRKCVSQFLSAARPHFGLQPNASLAQGADPGRLLTTHVTHLFPISNPPQRYYEAYSTWFREKANVLVP